MMSFTRVVKNSGSTCRDFCMLERNILSHLKLALLLSLMASSLLLQARLIPVESDKRRKSDVPFASVEFAASIACILAGLWEYHNGYHDLRHDRPFLTASKSHLIIMGTVSGVVFGTCIVLLVRE